MKKISLVLVIILLIFNSLVFSKGKKAKAKLKQLEKKIEVLSEEIEKLKLGEVEDTYQSKYGFAPAASKVYYVKKGISVGGYGEMLYENFKSKKDDGTSSGASDQVDFLRQVVYLGYKFSDKIIFNSEIEFEHASSGKKGEVSVELASLDFLMSRFFNFKAGLLLLPLGLINELHEPPVFNGAKRPDVETVIIPTTWRENGLGIFGENNLISYRLYLVSGLNAIKNSSLNISGFSASSGIRGGRSSASSSPIEDIALSGRLDYKITPDFLLGLSFYDGNSGQAKTTDINSDGIFETIKAKVSLWELHSKFSLDNLEIKGLYAQGKINEVEKINSEQGYSGNKSVGSKFYGWYLEAAYDISKYLLSDPLSYFAPFIRYEKYNTQKEVPAGFSLDSANDKTTITYGLTYKPHPNVVLKLDYQDRKNKKNTAINQINFALGYLF